MPLITKMDNCFFPVEKISGINSKMVIPNRNAPLNDRINFKPNMFLKGMILAIAIPAKAPRKGSIKKRMLDDDTNLRNLVM